MRRHLISFAVGFTLLLTVGLESAPPAAAADGVTSTATQTYEFRPAQHLVHVTVDLAIKNTIPSMTTYEPCIQYIWDPYWGLEPYSTTCPHTTNYYITDGSVWVEDDARNLKITADSGSVSKSVVKREAGFTDYGLTYQRTFYGHTRKIHATYDLPSAAPRSAGGIRAGQAYASFCVSGNGQDGGQLRVITPAGFDFWHTDGTGLTFTASKSGEKTVFSSGPLLAPITAWSCFEGINLNGFTRQPVQAPDGRTVIVAAWPEDPAWGAAVAADVRSSIPTLERLVGRSLPGTGAIEVREAGGLGDYAGLYDPDTNVALVGDDFSQAGLVAHELSHAWFNDQNFKSTWLSEGYADWVGSQNGAPSCDRLPAYPGTGKPDLEVWSYLGPKATATDVAVVDYQYSAACWVITSVADRIGSARMTAVLVALFEGTSPYGASSATNGKPATWQAWLDAVDELGMVPAGVDDLDLVQKELAQVGVATDSAQLAERSEARAAYHALVTEATGWAVPEAVRAPLTSWNFGPADRAIQTAHRARTDIERADAALPQIDALHGPIEQRWEAARSQSDLDAVASLADQEAKASEALAGAQQLEAGADPITRIGLIGTDTSSMFSAGVDAARSVNPALALASATQMTSAIHDAQGGGWLRLAIVGGGGAAFALFGAMRIRQRRKLMVVRPVSEPFPAAAARVPELAMESLSDLNLTLATAPMTLDKARDSLDRLASLVSDPETARALANLTPGTSKTPTLPIPPAPPLVPHDPSGEASAG